VTADICNFNVENEIKKYDSHGTVYIGLLGLQDFEKLNWQTAYWESGQSKFQKNAHQLFLAKKETRKLYLRPHRMHRTDAAYYYRCSKFSCLLLCAFII